MVLGNAVTKEKLDTAIAQALILTPPDLRQLLSALDGRETVRGILESLHSS